MGVRYFLISKYGDMSVKAIFSSSSSLAVLARGTATPFRFKPLTLTVYRSGTRVSPVPFPGQSRRLHIFCFGPWPSILEISLITRSPFTDCKLVFSRGMGEYACCH